MREEWLQVFWWGGLELVVAWYTILVVMEKQQCGEGLWGVNYALEWFILGC